MVLFGVGMGPEGKPNSDRERLFHTSRRLLVRLLRLRRIRPTSLRHSATPSPKPIFSATYS